MRKHLSLSIDCFITFSELFRTLFYESLSSLLPLYIVCNSLSLQYFGSKFYLSGLACFLGLPAIVTLRFFVLLISTNSVLTSWAPPEALGCHCTRKRLLSQESTFLSLACEAVST